ncbi:hypothetical protein Tco_1236085 [Tanacetum coccineum]
MANAQGEKPPIPKSVNKDSALVLYASEEKSLERSILPEPTPPRDLTPPRDPNPPRDESKGKDGQLSNEDVIAQVKEMKRLADLKAEQEESKKSLMKIMNPANIQT